MQRSVEKRLDSRRNEANGSGSNSAAPRSITGAGATKSDTQRRVEAPAMQVGVDLLHEVPQLRLDPALAHQTLTFAFATGGGGDAFERLLGKIKPVASSFSPECFGADLFLSDFVERCLLTSVEGSPRPFNRAALRALLSLPPRRPADVMLRQGVFGELSTAPELVLALERLWKGIDGFLNALQSAGLGKRSGSIARRLEILRQLAGVLRDGSEPFSGCRSALSRIAEFFERVRESPAFVQLEQLLDYDEHLATLELGVRIGLDGQIRELSILQQRENRDNPHHVGAWRRFWERLLARLRGYPIREQEVVGRLVEAVFEGLSPTILSLLQLRLDLEFYLALRGLCTQAEARGLSCTLPVFPSTEPRGPTVLRRVYNPLLLLDETPPIPCDLQLDSAGIYLLTGPNSGGKTRLLQTLGLVQLLAQSGCPVPAEYAELSVREGLFVSLVHEVTADQKEGRLGTELLRIRRLFERAGFEQLILIDELCSGTNPSEGEKIVELVIALLDRLRPQAVISTHFLEFAARLQRERPVADLSFLQVELDSEQRPRFQFIPGVATSSLAAQTAERLGVTREALAALISAKAGHTRG